MSLLSIFFSLTVKKKEERRINKTLDSSRLVPCRSSRCNSLA